MKTEREDPRDLTPMADCRACVYRQKLLLMGRCMPGDACVMVESGRQVDRFFRNNPHLASEYLKDRFWERRAIAVRYAPVAQLNVLLHDPDEAVRRAVA